MALELRPYQDELLDQARTLIRAGENALLIQSPTGSGKTVLVAKMLQTAAQRGYRSFFNVHRRELVNQSVITLTESAGMEVGIVAAGFPGNRHLPVQVCSIGTLLRRSSLLAKPSLIIWDEAHHLAAASWATLFALYPRAVHVGLTATPERLDGAGLGKWFKHLITGPSVAWLIQNKYLADYRLFAPKPPNLDGVHTVAGDYNRRELAAAMNKSSVTGDVISHYMRHAIGRRMVLFAWSIEASKMLAAKFSEAGVRAEHVDGDTPTHERDEIIARFRRGETRVMTNVDLFGEGFDVPAMEAVALLRPTQSMTLYLQQVGRALRPFPGKDHAVILDHAGNCRRFGMPDDDRTWSLDGRDRKRNTDATLIRQCPRCYAVASIAADICKACGFQFVAIPREIEQVEGELEEVDDATMRSLAREARLKEQQRARTFDDLVALARLRGYKNPEKWARHVYASRQAKEAGRAARAFATGQGALL